MQGRLRSAPTKHFLRELRKLPAQVRERIVLSIEEIVSNPYRGVRLRGELQGLLRWRIGDYRIIYKVDEQRGLIILLDVGARKSIYD